MPAVVSAGDLAVPGAAAVRDGQAAAVDMDDFAGITLALPGQPPVDGAAVQVKGHRAPGSHLEGRIAVQGRDDPAGAGNIPDIYNGLAARLIVDGVLKGLPQAATQQARIVHGVIGIADEVALVVALKESVRRFAVVPCVIAHGKCAGVLHAHADPRSVGKSSVFKEGDGHAVLQVQVALRTPGNAAVGGSNASLLISGDHRLVAHTHWILAVQAVDIDAAAQLLRPVAGNLAFRHLECSAVDIYAAAMLVHRVITLGPVVFDFSATYIKVGTHHIHAAALAGDIVDDRAAAHREFG